MHGGELTEKKRVGIDTKTHVSQHVCKDDVTKFSLCACVRAKFRRIICACRIFFVPLLAFFAACVRERARRLSDMGAVITPSERVYND